mmetsp:Transcript_26901/g.73953  ORF Transcript_26901/g.73953 Transcript_26901/m.73953 type:complete len:1741 (+) Transcript_26901:300-5522(+)|eukprot:CAMPEP_0172367464 /NCGR_PEP_ID=MMETSP1060-20121228/21366_1 /TAXON_ID=37318 /ORGANISM="Pseudo-nitzschia pungens, Strain cf. cingulata" /LENGTH=1740 /DNA_ID=CAMNT_0013091699 /DNA_START=231 /DNA_END=5453 /DNA_ORIENTATION=-
MTSKNGNSSSPSRFSVNLSLTNSNTLKTPRGGNSRSLAAPLVSACRHLLQPNGSIKGRDVAPAVLPHFDDLCSALPVESFGDRNALYGVDGKRRPITHTRIRDFILKDFGPTLHEYGFGRGQRIALVLPNGPELALAILACAHWASCVPLNANGAISELQKDLQASRAKMIIGMAGRTGEPLSDDLVALQDMARALNIPFYGMIPSSDEVGIFQIIPMSLLTKVPIDVANQANAAYEENIMMIQGADSDTEDASCCGTSIAQKNRSQMLHNHYSHPLERLATYNFLCNDHEDEVLVLFTSGTTGNKKLVPHKLGDMIIAAAVIAVSWNLSPDDINCNLMPLFHVGGIIRQVFAPILSAGSVICCPSFDAHLFWQLLVSQLPSQPRLVDGIVANSGDSIDDITLPSTFTWYYAAPTMHQVILANMPKVEDTEEKTNQAPSPVFTKTGEGGKRHLRMIANAAGGLLPSLANELRNTFGANVLPSYGMTECMPISSPPYDYELTKPGTSGVAVGPEICIFNNNMKAMPPNKEGNICVRGRPCFRGYGAVGAVLGGGHNHKVPKALGEGGWFNTGDLGYLDEDGYLFITGRSKEVINRGGEIISPLEVEEEIVQHPSILACAAFSAPHDILQEAVGIVLVHKAGERRLDLPMLHTFLQEKLAPAKWPQCLVYMDALPKSHTNKLLRVKLGQRLNLPELNDSMAPVERTFEATCPPQGTLVGVSIPSENVTVDLEYIQEILRRELKVPGENQVDEEFDAVQVSLLSPRKQLIVTAHPSRAGSVSVHVQNVSPREVIFTSERVFDAYLRPSHVCSYSDEISLQNIKKYPEPTDAVLCILRGDVAKRIITDPMVREIQELVQELIDLDCLPAYDSSFFHVGGSSLLASQLASRVRRKYSCEFSGTDVFRHNTCLSMAQHIQRQQGKLNKSLDSISLQSSSGTSGMRNGDGEKSGSKQCPLDMQNAPFDSTVLQTETALWSKLLQLAPTLIIFPLYQFTRFFMFFMSLLLILHKVPGERNIYKFILTLVGFHFLWVLITPMIFIFIKWTVIGRYRPGRYPIWGSYYLRWWIVDVCRKIIGRGVWGTNSYSLCLYYRMLGATIGRDANISLQSEISEFDLVTIGDYAKIEYGTVRGFGLDRGAMILGHVGVDDFASVGVRSVVAPHTKVPTNAHVGPGTSSYEITHNDDRHLHYNRHAVPEPEWWMQMFVCHPVIFLVNTFSHLPAMYVLYLLVKMHYRVHDEGFQTMGDLMEWLCEPRRIPFYILIRIARSTVAPFFYMAAAICTKWFVIGKFKPGPRDINNQWTLARHFLAASLFSRENMQQMTDMLGRHYEPVSCLYRLLGAKIGKRVFWPGHQPVFSGEFDLLEVGDDVVFGSRSVILTSTLDTSEKVIFCAGSNISDNTIVLPGAIIGKNAVLGSNTVCPAGRYLPEASIYLGSRGGEPMVLEPGTEANAKEVMMSVDMKEKDLPFEGDETTLRPFGRATGCGEANYFVYPPSVMILYRIFCNIIFAVVHSFPLLAALHVTGGMLYGWDIRDRYYDDELYNGPQLYFSMFGIFILTNALRIILCFAIEISAKWSFVGTRTPGRFNWHTSTYCQNWEFYQVLGQVRNLNRISTTDLLAGTTYMSMYYSALGSSIGKDCCLYPAGADPQMPEPDLVTIGDRCLVDVASIVSHLNTRGNFQLVKIVIEDDVTLRTRSRIQQGVRMEAGSMLLEKTLAMTGEVIDTESVWQGAPARQVHSYDRGSSFV